MRSCWHFFDSATLEAIFRYGSEEDAFLDFDAACGKCVIVKHPHREIKKCMMIKEGCHVYCRRGRVGEGIAAWREGGPFSLRWLNTTWAVKKKQKKSGQQMCDALWQEKWTHQLGIN